MHFSYLLVLLNCLCFVQLSLDEAKEILSFKNMSLEVKYLSSPA